MSNHYQVELEQQPIELYKLLKIANLVSGGGEAKVAISEGYVLLNGEVETQKRKKIYSGDVIQFNEDLVEMICHNEPIITVPRIKGQKKEQLENKENNKPRKNKKTANKNKSPQSNKSKSPNNVSNKPSNLGKRRAITF